MKIQVATAARIKRKLHLISRLIFMPNVALNQESRSYCRRDLPLDGRDAAIQPHLHLAALARLLWFSAAVAWVSFLCCSNRPAITAQPNAGSDKCHGDDKSNPKLDCAEILSWRELDE